MNTTTQASITDRMNGLSDPELAYIARLVALTSPEIAEAGLEALAAFKADYPDHARLIFGANGDK